MQECIRARNATIRKAVQTEDRQVTKKELSVNSKMQMAHILIKTIVKYMQKYPVQFIFIANQIHELSGTPLT